MAMGPRQDEQVPRWIATADLPMSPGHPFYARLHAALDAPGFDRFVEALCRPFYATTRGRPSLPPGRDFRLLLIGYFEDIDAARAVREFLRLGLEGASPDHSTISRTRRLMDVETHRAVFTWVQPRLVEAGLLTGKTIGIDATTLEANAAMRSILRRDTGETYDAFLTRLAKASGITTPTREALARFDRRRKKTTSNTDWEPPWDPDAKIAKMKDGRTHLAYKAAHAVDLETGAIVAVTLQGADEGDTATIIEATIAAAAPGEAAQAAVAVPTLLQDAVADKGSHSNATMVALAAVGIRSYVSEPERGRREWSKAPGAPAPVYANRRRIHGERGHALRRGRGKRVARSFAHVYDTGGMRRTHLRRHDNILKRRLVHAGTFHLGLVMRQMFGVGKPHHLQGPRAAACALLVCLY